MQSLIVRRRLSPRASSLAFGIDIHLVLAFKKVYGQSLSLCFVEEGSLGWLLAVIGEGSNDLIYQISNENYEQLLKLIADYRAEL